MERVRVGECKDRKERCYSYRWERKARRERGTDNEGTKGRARGR